LQGQTQGDVIFLTIIATYKLSLFGINQWFAISQKSAKKSNNFLM